MNPHAEPALLGMAREHLRWLVRHCPRSSILAHPELGWQRALDERAREDLSRAWHKLTESPHADTRILENAGAFFASSGELASARDVYERAAAHDFASPEVMRSLGDVYLELRTQSASEDDKRRYAMQALQTYEKALEQVSSDALGLLRRAAVAAFCAKSIEAARSLADEVLANVHRARSYDLSSVVQEANVIRGLIAVQAKDLSRAGVHLLAALPPAGSNATAGGPDLTLAKALTEHGAMDVVAEFLRRARDVWPELQGRFDEWLAALAKAQSVDFGHPGELCD